MVKFSPNLQHLTYELPADRRADIEAAIMGSPHLRQIMTDAVNAGTLEHIRMGVQDANEGGHYDDSMRAIYLSPDSFADPVLKSRPEQRLDMITSTLGHETGHALYADKARKELYFTTGSITDGIRAAGPGGEFDATGLVGAYISDARRNEAQAEIHGWDALASRIEYTNSAPPSRDEMLRRAEASTGCIGRDHKDVRQLATGIVLDSDMHMSDTRLPKAGPINLEPVAKCHFDNPRTSLGAGGAANYTNYYGAYLVQQLADDTRNWVNPPTIKMDMAKLGLDKTQLESTGLRLGDEGFSLIDTSRNGYKHVTLHSSGSGIQGTPEPEPSVAQRVSAPPLLSPVLSEASHPAHTMYTQTLSLIERGDVVPPGLLKQEDKRRLAAGAVAQFLSDDKNATCVDGVYRSTNDTSPGMPTSLIPVQGDPTTDYCRRASINVEQALQTPLEQSSQIAQTVVQARQQALALEQAQEHVRKEHQDLDGAGPKMRIGARTKTPASGPSGDGGGDGG